MNSITPGLSAAIADNYDIAQQVEPKFDKELGQDEFLELMMAQLENQDPMKPMDNGEFLGQMAQFSTVSGIEDMQASLEKLSATYATGQTLQATQLVGQEVLIENSTMPLVDGKPGGGSFELEVSSGDVKLDVLDSAGSVVRQIGLGEFPSGRHGFSWDGMDSNGNRLPSGNYVARITAQHDNEFIAATVLTPRVIDSVEFGNGGGSTLNTRQGEVLTLEDIRQIRQTATPAAGTQQ